MVEGVEGDEGVSATKAHQTGFGPNPLSSKCKGSTVTSSGAFSNSASSFIKFNMAGMSSLVAFRMYMLSMLNV